MLALDQIKPATRIRVTKTGGMGLIKVGDKGVIRAIYPNPAGIGTDMDVLFDGTDGPMYLNYTAWAESLEICE